MNVWFHISHYLVLVSEVSWRPKKPEKVQFPIQSWQIIRDNDPRRSGQKSGPGGFDDVESLYEKYARMYQTDDPNDGYNALCL